MPLLGIYVAQPCVRSYADLMSVQRLMLGSTISRFPYNRGRSAWKFFGIPSSNRRQMKFAGMERGEFIVKAVATLEDRSAVWGGERSRDNLGFEMDQLQLSTEDLEELEEREKLRRMRISKANKGNTPWNKGRKHSEETLRRIKERTRLAMQDPKVMSCQNEVG